MSENLLQKHQGILDGALEAIAKRHYWSAYPEMPSPKVYGETANDDGKAKFDGYLGKPFPLEQPETVAWVGQEVSPFGIDLNITYPQSDPKALIQHAQTAQTQWQSIGVDARAGILLEVLDRISKRSFEMAYSVMFTTGQAFMMAFQAGAPHALDRALEALAYGYKAQKEIPEQAVWEKPQGKNPPLVMRKHYQIVGRGVALVIGCATFPTWNTYPGMFASLITGNPVIVKPHPNAVLPAALTVQIMREVLAEQGIDPNVISLAISGEQSLTQTLALDPAVKIIDFTGSNAFGNWLQDNARQAQVYSEQAGVNNIVIDSADDYKGMLRNIAFSLSLYSGQMCTAPQTIFIPETGVNTPEGNIAYSQVVSDLASAVDKFLADTARAVEVLGAITGTATLERIAHAPSLGKVVLESKKLQHPNFPNANVYTPIILEVDAASDTYTHEQFGPIVFVVKTANTGDSLQRSQDLVQSRGALTVSLYTNNPETMQAGILSTQRSGVALSINLTGGVFVNQSAAYSDYHGTGANPAANASYTDSAFVSNRFRVIQHRYHI